MCQICADGKDLILGIDVGGTYTKIGMKTREGQKLLYPERSLSPRPENFVSDVTRVIANFLADKPRPVAVGLSLPADVDPTRTIMSTSVRFRCGDLPLKNLLPETHRDIPTFGINDGQAAGLGELVYGRNQEFKNFLFIALGTNVGGAVVLNGRLATHPTKAVGRVAHLCISMGGPQCRCGQRGCWEMYVSTKAILDLLEVKMKMRESSLSQIRDLMPVDIAEAAQRGDAVAIEVYVELAKYLAVGIANISNIFAVDAVFIGGGISLAGTHLFTPLERELRPRFRYADVKLIASELSDSASLYGAIALAEKEGKLEE